jgi:phosphopantothenate---cysteine ligase (ATP)
MINKIRLNFLKHWTVNYVTLLDYFVYLESISIAIRDKQISTSLTFLCAAVSDYYVPDSSMPEQKIQSSNAALTLTLAPSPKKLGLIKSTWNP